MQAILAREFGGPEVLKLEEVPDPAPDPDRCASACTPSASTRTTPTCARGAYAIKPDLPYTPGADAAGVIDQVGDGVTGLEDRRPRVCQRHRASAKRMAPTRNIVVCEPHQVHRLPDRISFTQGAGLFVPYVTAWRALFGRANTRAGDMVLIHGASGGVGVAATQFARRRRRHGDRHRRHGRGRRGREGARRAARGQSSSRPATSTRSRG